MLVGLRISSKLQNTKFVRLGSAGLLTGMGYSRVRNSTWIYLTSPATTWIEVKLVDVQGDYSTPS